MSAHTPGPWTLGRLSGERVVMADGESGLIRVADCRDPDEHTEETERANARLISAAPDLLAACETQQRTIDHLCAIVRQAAADLEHLSGGGTAEWAEASLRRLWDAWRKSENAHGVGPEAIAKAVGK